MANRRLMSNWYKPGQEMDFLSLAQEGDILEVWNWLPFGSNSWGVLHSRSRDTENTIVVHKVTGQLSGITTVSFDKFTNKQSYRINNTSDSLWTPGTQVQIVQRAMASLGPNSDLSPYDFAVKCRANLLRGNPQPVAAPTPPPTLPKPPRNGVSVLPPLPDSYKKH